MSIFKDSVVVVTGGGSGIGAALADAAAERGSRVAVADIGLETAQAVAAKIGDQARAYHVDVTDPASVEALAASVEAELGEVNFLFANAGVVTVGGLDETTSADFEWMYDVNVFGVQRTIAAFLPALLAQAKAGQTAHIITTGSENSFGLPLLGATTGYTSTKHAILGLTDGLRRDLRDKGIGVSILCPGMVVSNLADARSRRPDRYGGVVELPREELDGIKNFMRSNGQLPEETALLCLDGVERDEFMIIADPSIRALVNTRNAEIDAALAVIDGYRARTDGTSA